MGLTIGSPSNGAGCSSQARPGDVHGHGGRTLEAKGLTVRAPGARRDGGEVAGEVRLAEGGGGQRRRRPCTRHGRRQGGRRLGWPLRSCMQTATTPCQKDSHASREMEERRMAGGEDLCAESYRGRSHFARFEFTRLPAYREGEERRSRSWEVVWMLRGRWRKGRGNRDVFIPFPWTTSMV